MTHETAQPGSLIFDKYEIQRRLAVGGMGEVFLAVQRGGVRGFERPVILKSLLPDLAEREDFIEQFLDEARVAATLNHPNVVSIHEVGLWNGVYYIAMEYIRGRNLSQLAKLGKKRGIPIPPTVIAKIIHDAATGLEHAHSARDNEGKSLHIVHRDISPQNIMVREDGVTKVVDFGIARASNRASRTATGAIKGKLAYMAPEQTRGAEVGPAADQFALGVVLWEMCTGRRLFEGENDIALVKNVWNQPIEPMSKLVPGLPTELDEIALRMLQREPSQRYPSCADVARELEVFRSHFSPPTTESPVASYMKQLGTQDLAALTLLATPSKPDQNFVINLASRATPHSRSRKSVQMLQTQSRVRKAVWAGAALLAVALVGTGVGLARLGMGRDLSEPPIAEVKPLVEPPQPQPLPAALPVSPAPPAPVTLKLTAAPGNATVSVNGGPSRPVPFTWEGAAGEVTVTVEAVGYVSQQLQLLLTPGSSREVPVTLVKKPAGGKPVVPAQPAVATPLSSEPGFLTVSTIPDTKISVDGEFVGLTPVYKAKFRAGQHIVAMKNEELGIDTTRKVVIRPGEVLKISERLK